VVDTEHKLRVDFKNFYMHGVVDVIANADGKADELEIWDYKGSHRVEADSDEMTNYTFQMQVYGELYKLKNGKYPSRARLCFLAEQEFKEMVVDISLSSKTAQEAVKLFMETVNEIERRREVDDWSPPTRIPSDETCKACDIRWDCTAARSRFPLRYP
jgi:hypothetical protein